MAKKRAHGTRPSNSTANRSQTQTSTQRAISPTSSTAKAASNGSAGASAATASKPTSSTASQSTSAATKATNGVAKSNGSTTTKATTATAATRGTADSSASRLADMRARNAAQRAQAKRRAARQNSFWRRNWPLITAVVSVVLIVAIFVVIANRNNDTTGIGELAPTALVNQVTGVGSTVIDQVGTGSVAKTALAVPQGATPYKDSSGKPIVLFVGGDFCPYCAAERWSMIVALSRFGTFKNLHLMKSAVSDGNISTFTFDGSSYTSQYVVFQGVETTDRNQNALATLTTDQQAIYDKYVATAGSVPFFSIANAYTQNSAGYSYTDLSGLSWTQIGSKLSNPSDPVTQDIVGEANYLTAAICQTTNQAPEAVCKSATITKVAAMLPKGS